MVYEQLIDSWNEIHTIISRPKNEDDLNRLIALADYLMDHVRRNESLVGLLDYVGILIEEYEKSQISEPQGSPIDALKFMMKEHGLKQKDLTEIGSPGVVSEIMNNKRELNKRQIAALSERFHCNPHVFF